MITRTVKTPTSMVDLRDQLAERFKELQLMQLKPGEAKEISNMAGKIIGSVKLMLEYKALTKHDRPIDWLEPV